MVKLKRIVPMLFTLMALMVAGCTSSPSISVGTQPDADNLYQVSNGPFDETKVIKELKLTNYDSIKLTPVTVQYQPDKQDFKLSTSRLNEIGTKFTDILKASLKKNSHLKVVSTETKQSLTLNIAITEIVLHLPKDIERQINTKVYSNQPVTMSISGTLFDTHTGKVLVKFKDRKMPELITFEEMNKVNIGVKMRQMMRQWADKISRGINNVSHQ